MRTVLLVIVVAFVVVATLPIAAAIVVWDGVTEKRRATYTTTIIG